MSTTEHLIPLLKVDDLATYLSVPRKTIYQWRLRREGPPAIRVGGQLRYRHDDVEQWLETRKAVLAKEPDGVMPVADADARGGVVVAGGPVPKSTSGLERISSRERQRHGPDS